MYTPSKIAVPTHFHAQRVTKNSLVYLPVDGEVSWSLQFWSPYYQDNTVQPENTFTCILKVLGHLWKKQKKINININQDSFP